METTTLMNVPMMGTITTSVKSYASDKSFKKDNNIEIVSSEFERIPTTTAKLSTEQQEEVEKLLERLEEDDDVNQVYHSMEM